MAGVIIFWGIPIALFIAAVVLVIVLVTMPKSSPSRKSVKIAAIVVGSLALVAYAVLAFLALLFSVAVRYM